MTTSPAEPSLSIIVDNYNYAQFLEEALDSVLAQLNSGDELIVIDDGSTDGSPELLHRYQANHGVKLHEQPNQGQLKAVRVGIDMARGDVVVLLDSDDYFLPGYLDRLREIYARYPAVDFVFADAEVGGSAASGNHSARRAIDSMELEPGVIGTTRWGTILFFEFVGMSTSGVSLRRALAQKIITLPEHLNKTRRIPPLLVRLLRISSTEAKKAGLTADGLIVRAASMLGAVKFYDHRPGFFYRIHGKNKYANASALGRRYLRQHRKALIVSSVLQHFGLSSRPTAQELQDEVLQRHFGRRFRRRLHIRTRYCLAAITARGTLKQRLLAAAAAAGVLRG
ncbi:MAG: glycosyltransferase family A protein [Halioglobus sp.]